MGKFCNFLTDKVRKWECVDMFKWLNFSAQWHSQYDWRVIATLYIQTTFKKHFSTGQNDCSLQTSHPCPILVCWLRTKHCSQTLMRRQESPSSFLKEKKNFTSARVCSIMGWCPVPKTSEKQEDRLRAPRVFSSPLPTQHIFSLFPPSNSSHLAHLPHLPTQHIFSL